MSIKIMPLASPKRFLAAQMKRLPVLILLVAGISASLANAQPADLVLQNTTVTSTEVFTATNSIAAGPNFTVSNTGDATLSAPTVALKPRLFVVRGGRLYVISSKIAVNVKTENPAIPDEFLVHQNFPNPFNPTTQISYNLPKAANVEIVVYNIFGQEVRTLFSSNQSPGHHSVVWDGADNSGNKVSSGVYYYEVKAGKNRAARKMVLMK